MRTLFMLSLSLFSVTTFACESRALDYFLEVRENHEYHHIIQTLTPAPAATEIEAYGQTLALPTDQVVTVYLAASEYYGGYGVDAIVVNRQTCEVLDFQNVYSE